MRRKSYLPSVVACLASALLGMASQPSEAQVAELRAPGVLFSSDAPLTLRLEAPFTTVKRSSSDPQYSPARLSYVGPDGATVATDLRVRVRGKSRLIACSFPPLLLNFPTGDLDSTLLEDQNRLKLVTHCEPREANAQWVHLEYLAYRVLNLVTDASLRARPVEVTYFDTEREREVASGPGILLEDEERFAERQNWHPIKEPTLKRTRYDQSALALVGTFQYFIGNTDWSAVAASNGTSECCHNVVPFARDDGVLVPIVYDFDSSGIVNTSYALPDERREMKLARYLALRIERETTREDHQLIVWSSEAMKSSAFPGIILSDYEAGVRSYHDHLRRVLPVYAQQREPAAGTIAKLNEELSASVR